MKGFLIVCLVLVAFGIRFYYFGYPLGRSSEITVDEAVYGVQALQILAGERPIFYPAQDYTGSFSSYLSALLFKVFGVSAAALKIIPFLFSVLTVLVIYFLARLALGQTGALFSLFWVALGTPFWNNWASRAGTGYVEATFLGGLILILTLVIVRRTRDPSVTEILLLGLLSGLGFWIQPTIIYTVLPSLIFLVLNLGGTRMLKVLPFYLFGFLLGSIPVWYYNLFVRPSATTNVLLKAPWGVRGAAIKLATQGLPVILGGRTSNSLIDFNPVVSRSIYLSFVAAFLLFLRRVLGSFNRGGPFLLFFLTIALTVGVFLLSTPFNQLSVEPRYVFSLYLIVPVIWGSFLSFLWRRNPLWSIGLILILIVNFVLGLRQAGPLTFVDGYSFGPLVSSLKEKGVSYAVTTPAVGHRLMFYSHGSIKTQVRGGGIIQARFEEVNREVTRARDIEPRFTAYVNLLGEPEQESFVDEVRGISGDKFSREIVNGVFSVVRPEP